jgi:polyphenol oxidase
MQNYIQPNWPVPKNVHAYTTTRVGGFSKAPYESFNLADHVDDEPRDVKANREKLKKVLKLPSEPFWLKQTHSTRVISLDNAPNETDFTADASFTTKSHIISAVLTADCLPLLLAAKDGSLVAAIHAGWQGLAKGIIEETLKAITDITELKNLLVWLGPAIGPKAFIVQDDVRQKFIAYEPHAESAFIKIDQTSWLANIYTLARQRLENFGIHNIYGGDFCTVTDEKRFFSYRRDNRKTGRIASLIWLE